MNSKTFPHVYGDVSQFGAVSYIFDPTIAMSTIDLEGKGLLWILFYDINPSNLLLYTYKLLDKYPVIGLIKTNIGILVNTEKVSKIPSENLYKNLVKMGIPVIENEICCINL